MLPVYRPSIPPRAIFDPTENKVTGNDVEMVADEVTGAPPFLEIADDPFL